MHGVNRASPKHEPAAAARDVVDVLTDTAANRILTETEAHERLLAICLAESPRVTGNAVHDLHTAVLMREPGIDEILTEDRDFLAFPWVRVVPL